MFVHNITRRAITCCRPITRSQSCDMSTDGLPSVKTTPCQNSLKKKIQRKLKRPLVTSNNSVYHGCAHRSLLLELHHFDLLWICCRRSICCTTCCRFVVRSTTNPQQIEVMESELLHARTYEIQIHYAVCGVQ